MTHPGTEAAVTLDDVRQQFLSAETQLTSAIATLGQFETATVQLEQAKSELRGAAEAVTTFRPVFDELLRAYQESVTTLSAGVEALRSTEPAAILSRLERLSGEVNQQVDELRRRIESLGEELARSSRAALAETAMALRDALSSESKSIRADVSSLSAAVTSIRRQAEERDKRQQRDSRNTRVLVVATLVVAVAALAVNLIVWLR